MVGAINPPSIDAYNSFSVAAKPITTTATVGATPVTGIGAFASSTPTISALAVTPSPTPTSLSSSTPTPTSTSSPSPTTAPSAAPLGAIVGGAVGLIAFMFALWFFCLRNKQQAPVAVKNDPQNDDFFRYNPVTLRRPPTEGFTDTLASENSGGNLYHNPSMLSNTNSNQTARLAPLRRSPGPVVLEAPYLHRQMSQQSDINSTSSAPTNTSGRGGRNPSEQAGNVDIRALAQEVAAVLYQNPAKDYPPQDPRGLAVQNHDDEVRSVTSQSTSGRQQPPPNYRTAIGPTGPASSVGTPGKAQYP